MKVNQLNDKLSEMSSRLMVMEKKLIKHKEDKKRLIKHLRSKQDKRIDTLPYVRMLLEYVHNICIHKQLKVCIGSYDCISY